MTLEIFAIIAPLFGTGLLILFAFMMSDRDVAAFRSLEARRQSDETRDRRL